MLLRIKSFIIRALNGRLTLRIIFCLAWRGLDKPTVFHMDSAVGDGRQTLVMCHNNKGLPKLFTQIKKTTDAALSYS